jgi:hypothetical protein
MVQTVSLDLLLVVKPCRNAGTAIYDEDGDIDCSATIDAGRCPFREARDKVLLFRDPPRDSLVRYSCSFDGTAGVRMCDRIGLDTVDWYGNRDDIEYYDWEEDSYEEVHGSDGSSAARYAVALKKYANKYAASLEKDEATEAEKRAGIINWAYATWWMNYAKDYDGFKSWW